MRVELIVGLLLALALMIWLFNTMVMRKNRATQAAAGIDVMLKQRYDLIPNLLAVAHQYLAHERQLLTQLTALRRGIEQAPGANERLALEQRMSRTLRTFFAVAENYPQLRSSANYLQLQTALAEVEAQLAAARRAFNAAVTDFNDGCQTFPLNLAARILGYRPQPWLETPPEERLPIRIEDPGFRGER